MSMKNNQKKDLANVMIEHLNQLNQGDIRIIFENLKQFLNKNWIYLQETSAGYNVQIKGNAYEKMNDSFKTENLQKKIPTIYIDFIVFINRYIKEAGKPSLYQLLNLEQIEVKKEVKDKIKLIQSEIVSNKEILGGLIYNIYNELDRIVDCDYSIQARSIRLKTDEEKTKKKLFSIPECNLNLLISDRQKKRSKRILFSLNYGSLKKLKRKIDEAIEDFIEMKNIIKKK